jgi:uncharacterized SAM-binding protein YcdF (DUF218 family)
LFLTKLLPAFVYPLGAALLGSSAALALSFTRLRGLWRYVLAASILALWIASTPAFSNWFSSQLEAQYPPPPLETLPQADTVVLLGGALGQPLPPRTTSDLSEASDRIIQAWRLYRMGKAPRILISGGNLPWQAAAVPEAELIAELLVELGVPREALVLETASRNTRENALNSAALFARHGWLTGLLVTSGAHMPRALGAFRKAGLDLTPASTDIQAAGPNYQSVLDLLPDAAALAKTTAGVKELIGSIVYTWRGWM